MMNAALLLYLGGVPFSTQGLQIRDKGDGYER